MRLIAVLFCCLTLNVFAYTPSLESLLRNGNNIDIGKNTVVANLSILSIDPETNQPITKEEIVQKEVIKLLILNENEEYPKICQVNYAGGIMSNSSLINYDQKNFKRINDLFTSDENIDGELFYSLMSMLLNNNGSMLVDYLKKNNPKIKKNSELINKDKYNLLRNYKTYLVAAKEEDTEDLENPLKPQSDEKKQKVKEIQASNFLNKDEMVKKIKVDDEFYWIIESDTVYAKFDDTHRLKELKVTTPIGEVEVVLGNFIIQGAQMEFPEFIWLKDAAGRKYEIKATKVSMFQDNSDGHRRRLKRYRKEAEANKLDRPEIRPSFLL